MTFTAGIHGVILKRFLRAIRIRISGENVGRMLSNIHVRSLKGIPREIYSRLLEIPGRIAVQIRGNSSTSTQGSTTKVLDNLPKESQEGFFEKCLIHTSGEPGIRNNPTCSQII